MSNKNPRNQIDKATWTLVEGIKDVISSNLMVAAKTNQLGDVKAADLQRLLTLINASVDEGAGRGNRIFMKAVDNALTESALPELEAKKRAPSQKKEQA